MKTHLLFFLLLCTCCVIHSQTLQVKGTVYNANKETLPGVNIKVEGTTNGTITDIDGFFTLECTLDLHPRITDKIERINL